MTKNCEKSGSVKEVIQAERHNDTIANTCHVIRTKLQKKDVEKAVDTTQKVTTARTFALKLRLACLYVSLNNRARSLSTLISAAVVNRDVPHKIILVM